MGRILDAFRQGGPRPLPPEAPLDHPGADAEEIPFIEVGPRSSMDASPAVLAALPAARQVQARAPGPPSGLPRPHNVLFRSLHASSRFAPELVAFHAPGRPEAARYAELTESLLAAVARPAKGGRDEAPPVILFTAIRPGIGATTVLLNVAVTAARRGCRVVVLDANLRKAGVADRLGLEAAPGLTEVLAGDSTLEQALRPTDQANLTALTAGSPAPTLASSEALQELLGELRRAGDLVLVDGPRWDGRAGVAALAGASDGVFLVVPAGEADAPPASDLVRRLPAQGVALAGCVLVGP
jgi:Mrp family chromosome partitioning ATPase